MNIRNIFIILVILCAFSQADARVLVSEEQEPLFETLFQTALETMSYANKYENTQQAFRLGFTYKRDTSYLNGFQWNLDTRLWASSPQEVAHWFNVSQANITFNSNNFLAALGRHLPEWGGMYYYSPIQKMFPNFNIDPLNYQVNGLSGLYTSYRHGPWSYEFFYSPLFIPNSGGARYEEDSAGNITPASRWAQPLFYSLKKGEALIPLTYKIQEPEIKDVLFKNSFAVRAKFHARNYEFALAVADVMDPEPRLRLDPKLQIKDETDLKTVVTIFPEFYTQRIYSIEAKIKPETFENIDVIAEVAYIKPTNPEATEKNVLKAKQLNTLLGVSYLGYNSFVKNLKTGLLYSKDMGDESTSKFIRLNKSDVHFFYTVDLKLLSNLTLTLFGESDFKFDDTAMKTSLFYDISQQFSIGGGIDVIKGAKDTYWGQFGEHDRIWFKVKHVF